MIACLTRSILCSGLLLLVYFLFLEKEKMHRFNRIWLLFSLVFSMVVPFLVTRVSLSEMPEIMTGTTAEMPAGQSLQPVAHNTGTAFNWLSLLPYLYAAVSGFFLLRFARNLWYIYRKTAGASLVSLPGARLVLTDDDVQPCSFGHFIFVNREIYNSGQLEEEVLIHEQAHVKQKHTLDIILVELLQVIAWWNPFLFLYRRAIRLNHEFLADDEVLRSANLRHYQLLLVAASHPVMKTLLATPFNYSITKKRLIMMTRHTSNFMAAGKALLLSPLFVFCFFAFSSTATAQQAGSSKNLPRIEAAASDAPKTITDEYAEIINKYKSNTPGAKAGGRSFHESVTAEDKARLETLYKKMSREQQDQQTVGFMPVPPPFTRAVPGESQFRDFKNPALYGVWLNDKRVSNAELDKYQRTDMGHFFISRLYGAAKKGRSYVYQVNLMTSDYYQAYYNDAISRKQENIMFIKVGFKKGDTPVVK